MSVCRDFQRGKCTRNKCKFLHEMKADRQRLPPTGGQTGGVKDLRQAPPNKKKGVFGLLEFSYVLSELPVVVSKHDRDHDLCEEFCKNHNIRFESGEYLPGGVTHHPVDGKVIRDISTRRGLAAAIKLVVNDNPVKQSVSIFDLWGNNRTLAHLKRACGKGDFAANEQLFEFKCLAGQYDRKDLLRSNGRNNFLDIDLAGRTKGADIVLIQDVQQYTTSRENILALCQDVHVVVVIAHLELGPMGFNGYHGFWIREGDTIVNWASGEDEPYTDNADFSWVVNSSCADFGGYRVNWCVQQVFGNAVFVVFSKTYLDVRSSSLESAQEFQNFRFELSNSYRGPEHLKSIPNEIMESGGFFEDMVYHTPTAKLSQTFLKGSTFGPGTDKRLDAYVSEKFKSEPRLQILQKHRYSKYQELEIATVAVARRWEAERLYKVALLGASQATAVTQANMWRNLSKDDPNLNRSCIRLLVCAPCGCINYVRDNVSIGCVCLPLAMSLGCIAYVPSVISHYYRTFMESRLIYITYDRLPQSDVPPAFFTSVSEKADMSVLDVPTGVYKFGVFKVPKRKHTQTPMPAALRLGEGGKVTLKTPSKAVMEWPFTIMDMGAETSKMFTYHYGTMVPWHANEESPGGALGMIHALLTGVTLGNGEVLTAKESGIRGQRLFDEGSRMNLLLPLGKVAVEDIDRITWCEKHVKSAEYLPCLKRLINEGTVPTAVKARIIAKVNELLLKDKERIIITPGPDVASYFGAEASALHHNILDAFSIDRYPTGTPIGRAVGHAFWGSGTTPEMRGLWYDRSLELQERHFGTICCGDDMACIVNLGGCSFGIECDASNWDHCQIRIEENGDMIGMLNVQYWYYRQLGCSDALLKMLMEAGKELTWELRSGKSCQSIRVKLGYYRRLSGMLDTTDGNTLNTIDLYHNIIGELVTSWNGEDFTEYFTEGVTKLGAYYGVKIKVKVRLDSRKLTFLKGYFVDSLVDRERRSVWYPSPEILTKIGCSESNPENKAMYAAVAKSYRSIKDICLKLRPADIVCSWKSFTGMPLLLAFQMLYKHPVPQDDATVRARLADYDKWDRPELTTVVMDQDWNPMLEDLNITLEEIDEFTRLCAKTQWEPGMYIIHPILKTLAARYL